MRASVGMNWVASVLREIDLGMLGAGCGRRDDGREAG